jgi:hypothetical protein
MEKREAGAVAPVAVSFARSADRNAALALTFACSAVPVAR